MGNALIKNEGRKRRFFNVQARSTRGKEDSPESYIKELVDHDYNQLKTAFKESDEETQKQILSLIGDDSLHE